MITFPQIHFQKQMAAIGLNVKISDAWQFSTKMANGDLSLTAKNCPKLSIFMMPNEWASAIASGKSQHDL
jgi:hypothetical protein